MGSEDESRPAKPSKPIASTQDTPTTPSYPDWSTPLQWLTAQPLVYVYYGSGATPPPFFTSPVTSSPTPHPYLWGSHSQGAPPTAAEMEGTTSDGKDQTSTKKSKGSSGNTGSKPGEREKLASGSGNDGPSQSGESGIEGSSAASDQDTNQQELSENKKRSFGQMLADGANAQNTNTAQYSGAPVESSFSVRGQPAATVPVSVPVKTEVTMPATNLNIGMDLWNASSGGVSMNTRPNTFGVSAAVAPEPAVAQEGFVAENLRIQDERKLKRHRRKQRNRESESARRSRLEQAVCDMLESIVEKKSNDCHALEDELQRLKEECSKLTSENSSLTEQLTRLYGPEAIANLETNNSDTVINSTNGGSGNVQIILPCWAVTLSFYFLVLLFVTVLVLILSLYLRFPSDPCRRPH